MHDCMYKYNKNVLKVPVTLFICRFRTAPSAPAADLSFQKRNEEVDLPLLAKKEGISP